MIIAAESADSYSVAAMMTNINPVDSVYYSFKGIAALLCWRETGGLADRRT